MQCKSTKNYMQYVTWLTTFFAKAVFLEETKAKSEMKVLVAQSCSGSVGYSLHQAPLSGYFPGKNTGLGSHSLLQRIFPPQESNLVLLLCRQTLYRLSHKPDSKAWLGAWRRPWKSKQRQQQVPASGLRCYACRINLKFLRLKATLHKLALAYLSFLISYHPGGLDMGKCVRNWKVRNCGQEFTGTCLL